MSDDREWQQPGPPRGNQQWAYDYGVPNEDEYRVPHGPGQQPAGYSGDYGYTEPYDYASGRYPAEEPPPRRPVPPPPPAGPAGDETMQLGPVAGPPLHAPDPAPPAASAEPPVPGRGRAERRRAAKRIKRRRRLSATKEIPILVVVALAIAVVLKTFLVQAFVIPSGSMEQTIRIGDRVLVDKLTPWFGSEPERGDVVVFSDPGGWLPEEKKAAEEESAFGIKQGKEFLTALGLLPSDDEQDLIKRVVAVGGDTVACCDAQDRVTVNGTPLDEPYLHPGNKPSQLKFKVRVPQGRLFVMGDHRANSGDSRLHLDKPFKGTVPEDLVLGRALVIAWPFDHWRRLEQPGTYTSVAEADRTPEPVAADGAGNRIVLPPMPAELPLVIGVVGLRRFPVRRWRSVRSECGGRGGRRPVRFRRRRRRAHGCSGRTGAPDRGERQ